MLGVHVSVQGFAGLALCLGLVACSDDPGAACFATVKGGLKDPQTATLVSWDKVPVPGYTDVTRVTIRAANSYGGFGQTFGMCRPSGHMLTDDKYGYKVDSAWIR